MSEPAGVPEMLTVLEQLPVAIFVLRADGRPVFANGVARELLGADIVPSTGINELAVRYSAYRAGTDDLYPAAEMPLVRALSGELSSVDDMELDRPGGRVRLQVHGAPICDPHGKILYALGAFEDISDRINAARVIDALIRRVETALNAAAEGMFALDAQGRCTYVNRFAEQAVGYPRHELLGRRLHDVVHAAGSTHAAADCPLQISGSQEVTSRGEDVITRADARTIAIRYSSLPSGAPGDGAVIMFSPLDPAVGNEQLASAARELRAAIAGNQFVLYYQPKIEFKSGTCWSAEALIRWVHPERGLIFPDAFIPLAEQCGVIAELTNWVVRDAIRQRREWQDQDIHIAVSVNLSPQSLTDYRIIEVVSAALQEYGVSPRGLEVELTETAVMEDPAMAMKTLSRLAALGVACAIDDFGTGFSSLVYLRELPVETIKIDKSFVMRMDASDKDAAIVKSTVSLAQSLGKKVVAEGVETQRAADLLSELGCDTGQGYLWSRPIPAEAFQTWMAERRVTSADNRPVGPARVDDRLASPLLRLTRSLLRAHLRSDVQAALVGLVEDLGGTVAGADLELPGTLHLDLSLGEAEALVPVAKPGTLSRRLLEQALPGAIADAEIAMERVRT